MRHKQVLSVVQGWSVITPAWPALTCFLAGQLKTTLKAILTNLTRRGANQMFSNINKLLPISLVLGLASIASADTQQFPFTYTTKGFDANITASGYFVTDGYSSVGSNLAPSDITGWDITFTSPSFLGASFTLDSSNSNLSISGEYTIIEAFQAPNSLVFQALNYGGGFDLKGTVQFGQDQDQLEWRWIDGTIKSSITVTGANVSVVGYDVINTFPAPFVTYNNTGVGTSPTPTPEPGSLLLLGAGCLCLASIGRKKSRTQS